MRVAPDKLDNSENVGVALGQNLLPAVAATVTLYTTDALAVIVQKDEVDGIADAAEVGKGSSADDDLTSLTWLQNQNLLTGVRQLPKKTASKTSAGSTDVVVLPTESASKPAQSSFEMPRYNDSEPIPFSYDPQVHTRAKPPFSFSCLIFMAIEDSINKALPVREIYTWIIEHFPYYRTAPTGWKNSVRHNLSLNKCFRKAEKPPSLGKGSLWMVEQRYRKCLVETLKKSPYQYQKFIRFYRSSHDVEESSNGFGCRDDSNNCANVTNSTSVAEVKNEIAAYRPDSIEMYKNDVRFSSETFEDVDAATAMLVLKHGVYAFNITPDCTNLSSANTYQPADSVNGHTATDTTAVKEEAPLVISYPNQDHNYVYDNCVPTNINDIPGNTEEITTTSNEDDEEQRKIKEGADALLNLAGITTHYNTRKRYASSSSADGSVNGAFSQAVAHYNINKISKRPRTVYSPEGVITPPPSAIKTIKTDWEETEFDYGRFRGNVTNGDMRGRRNELVVTNGVAGNNGAIEHMTDDDTETASEEGDATAIIMPAAKRRILQRRLQSGICSTTDDSDNGDNDVKDRNKKRKKKKKKMKMKKKKQQRKQNNVVAADMVWEKISLRTRTKSSAGNGNGKNDGNDSYGRNGARNGTRKRNTKYRRSISSSSCSSSCSYNAGLRDRRKVK